MDSQTLNNVVADEVDVHNLEAGNEIVQGEQPQPKKARVTHADCWKYFTKLKNGADGIGRAKCNGCARVFKAGG
ncbi:hypothetical protein A2U01_0061822, partial [Trifolium medium]|nr:hypothetical protein [Trifolium medium]